MKTKQDFDKQILESLKNKHVKVIFQDIDKPHLVRGVLAGVGEDFILIKGDYNEHVIPISSILKISSAVNHESV